MYGTNDLITIIAAIVSIAMIVVFFTMSARLKSILDIAEFFQGIALKDPSNWTIFKCDKCGKDIKVAKSLKGHVNCPSCKAINVIPSE